MRSTSAIGPPRGALPAGQVSKGKLGDDYKENYALRSAHLSAPVDPPHALAWEKDVSTVEAT